MDPNVNENVIVRIGNACIDTEDDLRWQLTVMSFGSDSYVPEIVRRIGIEMPMMQAWTFAGMTGLVDLLYAERVGLFCQAGIKRLELAHVRQFESAFRAYPTSQAWTPHMNFSEPLEWLYRASQWAVEHCPHPALEVIIHE